MDLELQGLQNEIGDGSRCAPLVHRAQDIRIISLCPKGGSAYRDRGEYVVLGHYCSLLVPWVGQFIHSCLLPAGTVRQIS